MLLIEYTVMAEIISVQQKNSPNTERKKINLDLTVHSIIFYRLLKNIDFVLLLHN